MLRRDEQGVTRYRLEGEDGSGHRGLAAGSQSCVPCAIRQSTVKIKRQSATRGPDEALNSCQEVDHGQFPYPHI